jgi:peptidoglycan/LPS O-acetylase OafA/YrhL
LAFAVPLVATRLTLQPLFPAYSGWSDFFYWLGFYVYGYILVNDERFMQSIRRDWPIHLFLSLASTLLLVYWLRVDLILGWLWSPDRAGFYLVWAVVSLGGWTWTLSVVFLGMRYLNFGSRWLEYSREASFPIYIVHFPVVVIIAFYVVRWEVGTGVKFFAIALASVAISLGLYELLIRQFNPVRVLFGMRPRETPLPAPSRSREQLTP